MSSWLHIDPEEFITTVALTTPQRGTDEQAVVEYSAAEIEVALQNKQVTADQALWLHDHNMNWEITA